MIARARGLVVILACLAACSVRTRRVGVVSAPPEPPPVTVAPLEAAELTREPTRGLILAAGGPGRARPVRLAGRPSWLALTAPASEKPTAWATFWLIARPADPRPASSTLPPSPTTPDQAIDPETPHALPDAGAPGIPVPPTGPPLASPAWTRALWLARRAATATVGRNPIDFELDALSRGRQVEPPAEATLAVAAIAALTGARLARSATVVAELDPDGTLAPLDDPVSEVERAIRRGARRIVLPLDGGLAPRPGGERPVDLVELARQAGATTVFSPDLAHAYRALTSAPLPEPQAISSDELVLSTDEIAALETAYRRALERVAVTWPRVIEQQDRARLPPPLAALIAGVERGARRAERWRVAGEPAAAYLRLVEASALADAARALDEVLRLVSEGDLDRARAAIDSARAAPEVARLIPPGDAAPATIGEHLRAASLFALAAGSWAWSEEAGPRARAARTAVDSLARSDRAHLAGPIAARKVADAVAPLVIASARARLHAEMVQDRAGMEPGGGPSFAAEPRILQAIAAADVQAGAAFLTDLTRAPEWQDGAPGLPPAGSDAAAAAPDSASSAPIDLVVAGRILSLVDGDGELVRGSGRARVPADRAPLLALALARSASDRLAEALARMRRLRLQVDPWTGQVTAVGRPARLRVALELAERAALQQAAVARVAVGTIPLGARLAYRAAAVLAQSDRLDRVKALELYQIASAECRLAALLALSEAVPSAPPSAAGTAVGRAECRPSPSAPRWCR